MKKSISFVLTVLFLNGCASVSTLSPQAAYPQDWSIVSVDNLVWEKQWWTVYGDEKLNSFLKEVFNKNSDLAIAASKVEQALYKSNLTNTNKNPDFNASARTGVSKNIDSSTRSNSSSISAGLSYEIDLWGKLSSQRNMSRFALIATQEDKEAVQLALSANAVNAYFQHQYLSQNIKETEASIVNYEKLFKIVKARKEAGKIGLLEVLQTERILTSERNNLVSLNTELSQNINSIKLLLDLAPQEENNIIFSKSLTYSEFPDVLADIPVKVLDARPDVRAARLRLSSSFENIEATEVSYYPSFSLTGSLGTSSTQLLNILSNPVAALGAGITLPFLNFNERKWNIKIAQSQYEENVISFRQKLYTAMKEVADTQTSFVNEKAKFINMQENLKVAEKIEKIQGAKYSVGQTALKDWLDSQESLRQSRLALLQSQYGLILTQNKAYQAIGGLYKRK